jgi:hypothetical protein
MIRFYKNQHTYLSLFLLYLSLSLSTINASKEQAPQDKSRIDGPLIVEGDEMLCDTNKDVCTIWSKSFVKITHQMKSKTNSSNDTHILLAKKIIIHFTSRSPDATKEANALSHKKDVKMIDAIGEVDYRADKLRARCDFARYHLNLKKNKDDVLFCKGHVFISDSSNSQSNMKGADSMGHKTNSIKGDEGEIYIQSKVYKIRSYKKNRVEIKIFPH